MENIFFFKGGGNQASTITLYITYLQLCSFYILGTVDTVLKLVLLTIPGHK